MAAIKRTAPTRLSALLGIITGFHGSAAFKARRTFDENAFRSRVSSSVPTTLEAMRAPVG